MGLANTNNKKVLRKRVLDLLNKQKESERLDKSAIIFRKLLKLRCFQEAERVLFYISFGGEVDTHMMIIKTQELGKKIGVPRINKAQNQIIPTLLACNIEECEYGPFGIRQPSEEKGQIMDNIAEKDLVVVPGLAFDKENNRLGRGLGFYDRFLSGLSSKVTTVGLAFDFQMFNYLPNVEKHDVVLSKVLFN